MSHLIPRESVDRYTAAPSQTTVATVKRLHEHIRDVLGGDYETFLQGSYKNDTSIPDLNDVDIVAVRRTVRSGIHQPPVLSVTVVPFETIFDDIQRRLEGTVQYRGKTTKNDKCITVATAFSADVVPAVTVGSDATRDPIAIFSRRRQEERLNHPRVHYENGVGKHQRTNDRYKPAVRMFKRWARNWFGVVERAPSFYIESLVHTFTDESFSPDAAATFINLAGTMVELPYGDARVKSVAADKQILVPSEWGQEDFLVFQNYLRYALGQAREATSAYTQAGAVAAWRRAFNE